MTRGFQPIQVRTRPIPNYGPWRNIEMRCKMCKTERTSRWRKIPDTEFFLCSPCVNLWSKCKVCLLIWRWFLDGILFFQDVIKPHNTDVTYVQFVPSAQRTMKDNASDSEIVGSGNGCK